LYIIAKRELAEPLGTVYYRHRPVKIDKRVLLPISFKEEEVKRWKARRHTKMAS
jgi:hypothetical protein